MSIDRALVLFVALAGCTAETDIARSELSIAVPTSAGLHPLTFVADGEQRACLLYLPAGYDPMRPEPYPLVLMFHGAGGSAEGFAGTLAAAGMRALVDTQGKIVVFMQARPGTSVADGGSWNVFGLARDDIGYTDVVIALATTALNVDEDRIYAGGYSLGGRFVHELAADDPTRFAAIADVAGFYSAPVTSAPPVPPAGTLMPVLILHGGTDPVVPPAGGGLLNSDPTQVTYDSWYTNNDCTEPTFVAQTCTPFPPPTGPKCWDIQTTDCTPTGSLVLEYVLLTPHNHAWPTAADGLDAADSMLSFFDSH